MPTTTTRAIVSREEFESFEKNVVSGFNDLRSSIHSLSTKIDAVHSDALTAKSTDWKVVFSGLSLLLGVVLAIGGLIAFSINDRVAVNRGAIETLEIFKDRIASSRWTRQDHDAYALRNDTAHSDVLVRATQYTDGEVSSIRVLVSDVSRRVDKLDDMIRDHQRDGHPHAVMQRIDYVEERLNRLQKEEAP